ncbi:hypothetical protein G5C51_30285 [Streptomyces sp. A7024]|uniref:Lipoprotein n=1 Tax=Streptomyces coryli TaxID=1128680 RepID=A0A6G4U8Z7_9ACTN|nr:hypothetical protein [Streptomyces coryli]NGN68176.1 hypothetical protein [Streptomyces coryli]
MRYPTTIGVLAAVALGIGSIVGCGSSDEAASGVPEGAYESSMGKDSDGLKTLTLPPPTCKGRPDAPDPKHVALLDSGKVITVKRGEDPPDGINVRYSKCSPKYGLWLDAKAAGKLPNPDKPPAAFACKAVVESGDSSDFETDSLGTELLGDAYCLDSSDDDESNSPIYYVRFDEIGEPYGSNRMPTLKISYKKLT